MLLALPVLATLASAAALQPRFNIPDPCTQICAPFVPIQTACEANDAQGCAAICALDTDGDMVRIAMIRCMNCAMDAEIADPAMAQTFADTVATLLAQCPSVPAIPTTLNGGAVLPTGLVYTGEPAAAGSTGGSAVGSVSAGARSSTGAGVSTKPIAASATAAPSASAPASGAGSVRVGAAAVVAAVAAAVMAV